MTRSPVPERAGSLSDRVTLDRGEGSSQVEEGPKRAGDSHLGMRLGTGTEVKPEDAPQTGARATIPWSAVSSRPGPIASTMGLSNTLEFGPYQLIEEVGRGGMGVVYKARQVGLDRIVAIKMILANHLASAEQIERFYAEARAAARIQDPRVVSIHDVGQIHGQHYFAMEFVPGSSLAQLLRKGPLEPDQAARYVLVVAQAVARLHRMGVVHRDLKPSNILLDEEGQPCITDFGLAKMLSTNGPSTRSGAIVGTPSYMAPEQATGKGSVGPLSDVYSLGTILYELLTGQPPFDEKNPLDTLVQVLESEPRPPRVLRHDLPRALEKITLRCLEKAPANRYGSAAELAEDLERYLRGEPVEARLLTPGKRVARWARREPALVSRLATLGLCGLITQLDQQAFQRLDSSLNRRVMILITLGVMASLVFQTLLKRERWAALARYVWSTADMILFTSLMVFTGGLSSPLVAGYVLLVAASGLWFRERLVWYTAGLAVLSYSALVAFERAVGETRVPVIQPLLFVLVVVVTGFVVAYQVKRVRALSAYYETRRLP